ncbi:hypothetical protein F5J12DRAFT_536908 [Pisolithus orientalis]|uniref:uncharacterized protein n=1 Tax=Pisolithus orientalis TaxID=936130 RepID=UPI002225A120|nr:uncharacterized protein F5J12DRAFT_536908 [Pisolithus orientalis]KAI6012496.1 hypothetical protein F5J12DRAFT_536908 [Pisolithus orientalis]
MVSKHRAPRKQKRGSLSSRAQLARLMKEVTCGTATRATDHGENLASASLSPSSEPSSSGHIVCTSVDARGKAKTSPMVNYANILLIERFQAAVETRTAICRRLEQLVRSSTIYSPAVQNRLVRFLRDDFIRGDRTLQIIEGLRHSDFISAPPSEDGIDIVREEVSESTKMLFEGSKELMVIGDQIATYFS